MGMYTRLVLNVALDAGDAKLIETVAAMVRGEADHLEGRLAWMLLSNSYYHDAIQHASFELDAISKAHKLSVTCDLKNYENEIDTFLKMIAPVVTTTDLAGYVRYEEDEAPTLVYFVNGEVLYHQVELPWQVTAKLNGEDVA